MIYILTYTMGEISGLFENAFTDRTKAEKAFKDLKLTKEYWRKELWCLSDGKRTLVKEERLNA